jgi:hypothetical protein
MVSPVEWNREKEKQELHQRMQNLSAHQSEALIKRMSNILDNCYIHPKLSKEHEKLKEQIDFLERGNRVT